MATISKHHSWEINPAKVEAAVRKIVKVSRPVKLILFGSYIRGKTNVNSDLDMLVIAPDEIGDPRKESVRIRRALRGISMPMDILVIPQTKWDELKDVPGLIYHEALRKGRGGSHMKPKKMPGSPQEWLSHAKSDLRLAHLAATDELAGSSFRHHRGYSGQPSKTQE